MTIIDCLTRYRSRFDDPACWYDAKRFDRLAALPTGDRLLGLIRSAKVERCIKSCRK